MAFNYSYNKQAEPDLLYDFIISNTSVVPLNLDYNLATFDIVVSYSVALTIGQEGDLNNAISNYTYTDTNNNANFNTVLVADISATTVTSSSYSGDGSGLTNLQTPYVTGFTYNPVTNTFNISQSQGIAALSTAVSSFSGLSVGTLSATTYQNLPTDVRVTGGTFNPANGIATFTNNTGGTFSVSGFTVSGGSAFDVFVTGGTANNDTKTYTFTNNSGNTFTVTALTDITVTGGSYTNTTLTLTNNTGGTITITGFSANNTFTGGTVTGGTNFTGGLTANTISATTYSNLPIDIRVTGGTYNAGTATFTNNVGDTFTVTGFTTASTGSNIVSLTALTYSNNVITTTNSDNVTNATLINTMTGLTVNGILSATTIYGDGSNITGISGSQFTGGTVNGGTKFTAGLSANTISATTYFNLPTDVFVTGGTANNDTKTYTFTNNTGGTFTVSALTDITVTGITNSNNIITLTNNTGGTTNTIFNTVTGFTVNGDTVSTTISGTSYTGNNYTFIESVSATTPTTGATIYLSNIANRKLLAQKCALDTTLSYQPAIFNSKIGFWNPSGNVATAPGIFGIGTLTATGTATARAIATTNIFTRTKRIAVVSGNPAGSACGYRSGVAQYTLGTGTAGVGGFYYVVRFGCGDALTARRQFVGLRNSTGAPTDVEPSTLTNSIGVGHGTANTNLLIYYGGSAAQTPINLGANFPANTNSTDLYELVLYAPSTSNNQVWYQVTRLNTGNVASGLLTGTAGTVLPASTTLLTNNDYRSNGGATGVVTLEYISIYIETEN